MQRPDHIYIVGAKVTTKSGKGRWTMPLTNADDQTFLMDRRGTDSTKGSRAKAAGNRQLNDKDPAL